jgi:alpha-2-macroglobulin
MTLIFSSCSSGDEVTITSKNFQDVIEVQQNLTFIFSEDLAPDSLINQWVAEEYILFNPVVKGKYKWTAKNELTFSPDIKFAESTDYTATFTEKLFSHLPEKKKLAEEFQILSFHTAYLNLGSVNTFWAKNEIDRSINEVINELSFNYIIDANQLQSLLEIKVNKVPVKFDLKTKGASQTVLIAIQEHGNYNDKALSIAIKPGLKCTSNAYQTKEAIVFESIIPSKDNFRILQIESLYEDDKGYLQITTNQEVGTVDIDQKINIDPAVSFRVDKLASGFKVSGNFVEKQTYSITVDKSLQGIFGGKLPSDFEQTVAFGPQQPYLNFSSKKGIYLSNAGFKNIGLKVINVPKIKVTIHKIYENNLNAFFRQNSYYFSSYQYEEDYYDDYAYLEMSDMGDIVYEKTISTKSLSREHGLHLLPLQFNNQNDFKGLYVVKVQSDDDQWINATKIVSFSDIGMIAKASKDQVVVFVNSILKAEPIGDVKVTLVSSNNQQVYTMNTNSDGIAVFDQVTKKAPGFQIKMVTCQKNSDFNYLFFDHTQIETSRFDVGGVSDNPSGYDAYLYGDRDIYRPGETIYLNTIVRDEQLKALKNAPIKIKLTLPNGKDFVTKKGTLNAEGAFATSIVLPSSIVTGTYTAEVYTANDVLLQSKYLSIEEFLPDRIKLTTTLNNTALNLSQTLGVTTKAENFFGPPASDRKYEMEMTLKRKYFAPKGFEHYGFNLSGAVQESFEQDLREGMTDDNGTANESFTFLPSYENNGVLDGKVYLTVFDESGRPVHSVKSFEVITQNTLLGIKNSEQYVGTKQNLPLAFCAVNKAGQRISGVKAKVQVIKYEWQTVIRNNYDGYRYVSEKKQTILEEKIIGFGAQDYIYNFYPSTSGEYEVRLSLPDAKSYVSTEFYAYGYGTTNSSFEVSTEGNVDINTDKEEYEVGDEAKLLFKTPFAGKILVTVERNKVLDHYYINTDHRSASLSIPIKAEYIPNAYITATLIKPHSNQQIPLTVAHGFIPLKAKDKKHRMPVVIKAPERCRSNSKQTICISTAPEENVEVTVAVVDEGILQLKNTKSANPYEFFFRKKALEVNTYDIYPNLLPELSKSSMAGDGYDLEKRVNPMSNRRVNLMAYWSGLLKTNSSGEACYTINIPSFSGDLRIMAVAYKDDAFGSAQANMKVADPLVVYTSLPRFLSPGDTVFIPVNMTNTTGKATNAQVKLNVSGPLKCIGSNTMTVNLAANKESKVYFKAVASSSTGEVSIATEVTGLNETFKEQNFLNVRPAASLVKVSGAGQAAGGSIASFGIANNFISGSGKGKLIISTSPIIQFSDHLDELIGYPHGCVEQTVSKAFPQLYVKELIKNFKQGNRSEGNPDYNIQEAIRKLAGMQLNNGGISYWPGGYQENWWGTVYAAHFLYEAKRAGYQVDQDMLEKIYSYLSMKLKAKATEDLYYYETGGSYKVRNIAAKEIFYSLFVLAQAGHQDVSLMNYYKSNINTLALDSRYLLASTYRLLGDMVSFMTILPKGFEGEKSANCLNGNFYSYTRDMAISLSMLIDSDPNNNQIGTLAKHLSEQLKTKSYLNTQELAFSFIALGKIAQKANQSTITASIKANGQVIGQYTKGNMIINKDVLGKNIEIKTSGTGNLYYFWEAQGLPNNGDVKEEDSYLTIRKAFFDRKGNPITDLTFKQNDLIVVRLTLHTIDQSTVSNVVITDILPAGFEIENPRLSEQSEIPWIKSSAVPEHFDIRDDRINLYTAADRKPQQFYYIVRAVSKGQFKMGPASADAMYNGEYHSYSGAASVTVE